MRAQRRVEQLSDAMEAIHPKLDVYEGIVRLIVHIAPFGRYVTTCRFRKLVTLQQEHPVC